MKIVLLGPPGAGKGTVAVKLARDLGVPHISTGDIFREEMKAQTELGRLAQSFIDQGQLVPDEVVLEIVRNRLQRDDASKGFVLDGFPRTLPQAEKLVEILKNLGGGLDRVVYLEASESAVIQRLGGRRVCKKCGANFHVVNIPPRREGICDHCGGHLYQRKDDLPGAIRKRLKEYEAKTAGLVRYYLEKNQLQKINGSLPPQETYRELKKVLGRAG